MRRLALRLALFCLVPAPGCYSADVVAEPVSGECVPASGSPLAGTVAVYSFDADTGTTIQDALGAHPAQWVGGQLTLGEGHINCGKAIEFDETESYVLIPAADAWRLQEGSVDFWLRTPKQLPTSPLGLITRDASHEVEAGHLAILFNPNGTIIARLQHPEANSLRCSTMPVPLDAWVHIAYNFGGPGTETQPATELFVNGQLATLAGAAGVYPGDCNTDVRGGIAENNNSWVVGASSDAANDGEVNNLRFFASDIAIDELRISAVRRPF